MKKKMLLAVVLGIFLLVGNSWAGLINQGDLVKVFQAEGGANNGGAFKVTTTANSLLTYTFCLEKTEIFTPGNAMLVANLSTDVLNGGANNPNPNSLTSQAAYLFDQYIATYGLDGSQDPNINDAYQAAIWGFENEAAGPTSGLAKTLYDDALDNAILGSFYGVQVLNFTYSGVNQQSMLYQDPVPEPVSMLLFGTGLVAAGGYVRRRFKK
jgi:hypothetical protein